MFTTKRRDTFDLKSIINTNKGDGRGGGRGSTD